MINKYRLIIKGRNPDYFIKKLIRNRVNIYEMEKAKDRLYVVVDEDGLSLIEKFKTSYSFEIIDRYGKAKIKYLFNK